jgi:predicted SprT family Zn-dependent metalloprotease
MASPLVLMSLTQGAAKMLNDASYHAQRARTERELAYRAPDERVGDAHLRLSALHLSRAMVLEEVDRRLGAAEPRRRRRNCT